MVQYVFNESDSSSSQEHDESGVELSGKKEKMEDGENKEVENDFQPMPKMTEEELRQRIQEQEDDILNFLKKLNKQVEPIYNPDKPYQHRQVREFEQELVKDGTYDSKCEDVYDWCKNLLKQWELKLMVAGQK